MKKQDTQNEEIESKKIGDLEKEVEGAKKETEEWKGKCMRALADYQNLERRNALERDEIRKFASEALLVRFLSAIDTLAKAKDHIKDAGLDLAFKEFVAVLQEQHVEKIKTIGEDFDPH